MKHKRQTLSKEDPDIKESKSKSESRSSLNDESGNCDGCELPAGGANTNLDQDTKEGLERGKEICFITHFYINTLNFKFK